jgi:hypothetical protein
LTPAINSLAANKQCQNLHMKKWEFFKCQLGILSNHSPPEDPWCVPATILWMYEVSEKIPLHIIKRVVFRKIPKM